MRNFDGMFMEMAETVSKMSRAERAKVGALLVRDGNVLAFGFNGTPSGFDNRCEEVEFVLDQEAEPEEVMLNFGFTKTKAGWMRNRTKREVLHAESNAISKIARSTQSSEGATLYVTMSPCFECSKQIIQAGIKKIVYAQQYRDTTPITFLRKANIEVVKYERAVSLRGEVSSTDNPGVHTTTQPETDIPVSER